MGWLWDERLVEVWASPAKAGSGVAVGDQGVLTARHVIAGVVDGHKPCQVLARRVRRGTSSSWVAARVVADDPDWDLAVLEVDHIGLRDDAWVPPSSPFPAVAALGTAVEHGCEAVGFPDENVQRGEESGPGEEVRQSEQVWGTLLPMGQAKPPIAPQRRLPRQWMPLDADTAAPAEQVGWGGMSGAGVLLPDGRLVGVVVAAEAARQHRRLYVVPLATAMGASLRLAKALATVAGAPVVVEPRHPAVTRDVGVPAVPVIRSAYLQQVKRIAPEVLQDRDAELAELTRFCTDPDQGPYMWWRAPAWAGKSALMSWFVVHPPLGVRVVSFFITARFADQSDRVAFINVALEQLAELLQQPMPTYLTEATREPQLLAMLAEAAEACQQHGQRLVLAVDGLDEDRGVTTGADAHSIAALLPAQPPAGMRVIVAGRPDPPIPNDVPAGHPLSDPAIVRTLGRSTHAQVVREDAERELDRLLEGTPAEQSLLGLVTAAGGGLSGRDLAELTGLSVRRIEKQLRAVAGRTFTRRVSPWQPDISPEVYILGHEELQKAATEYLGAAQLDGYRQQLHAWADRYCAQGWPPGTPEYLLRGYYRLLHVTGDTPRMVACATDQARHHRMLDITGGDTAALSEITSTQDIILSHDEPDLLAMARLAIRRDHLAERNAKIPTGLPAAWAILDQPIRADALARSITNPNRQAQAWTAMVEAVASAGEPGRVSLLADRAETAARSITDHPPQQAYALTALARAVARAGDPDRAEALARSIEHPNPGYQADALIALARVMARAGDLDRARALAAGAESLDLSIPSPDWQAKTLTALARVMAGVGDPDRAEALARSIGGARQRSKALVAIARVVATSGDPDRADALAQSITRPSRRWATAMVAIARVVAGAGDLDRAEALARSISNPGRQSKALLALARAAASAGDLDRAEALARSIAKPGRQSRALLHLARAAAGVGDLDRAEALARSIAKPGRQSRALLALARAAASAGDLDRARALAGEAEALVRSITDPYRQAGELITLARAVAGTGDLDRARALAGEAEALVRSITDPYRQAGELITLARAVAGTGDLDRARALAGEAEALVRSITDPYPQAGELVALARVVATAGDPVLGRGTGALDHQPSLAGVGAGRPCADGSHRR